MVFNDRRGIVLLHVVVLTLVIAVLSIGVLRWLIAGRHIVRQTTKVESSRSLAEGCLAEFYASLDGALPTLGTYSCANGATVGVSGAAEPFTLTVTAELN